MKAPRRPSAIPAPVAAVPALAVAGLIALALLMPAGRAPNAQPFGADCQSPPLPAVNWQRCDLTDKPLRDVDLSGARLREARFIRADLSGSNLARADARRAKFVRARALRARFDGADLREADFTRATLADARFREADLRRTRFFKADLRGADFTGARLGSTDFLDADLSGARWTDGKYVCRSGSIGQCL